MFYFPLDNSFIFWNMFMNLFMSFFSHSQQKTAFDEGAFGNNILENVERPWTLSSYPNPTEPKGKNQ